MKNETKRFVTMNLDILYTMSDNISGCSLLDKALQLKEVFM